MPFRETMGRWYRQNALDVRRAAGNLHSKQAAVLTARSSHGNSRGMEGMRLSGCGSVCGSICLCICAGVFCGTPPPACQLLAGKLLRPVGTRRDPAQSRRDSNSATSRSASAAFLILSTAIHKAINCYLSLILHHFTVP